MTYEATDPNDKTVELTVYRADSFMHPEAAERALQELRQISTVDDPRIVHVYDSGKLEQGGIYEVHEKIEGEPLSAAEPQSREAAVAELKEVAAAVEVAAKVGALHRNLGPDTVVRTKDGIKVGWFAVGEPQGGVSFGAIECIAPEQVEGKDISEATLVYNLAALGHRLLEGGPLFAGDVATQLLQHAASTPPPGLPAVLAGALAKDPSARPSSVSDFAGDLDKINEAAPAPIKAPAGLPGFGRLGALGRSSSSSGSKPKLAPPPGLGGSLAAPPTLGGGAPKRPLFGPPSGKSGPSPVAPKASPAAPKASPAAAAAPVAAPTAPPVAAPKLGAPAVGAGVGAGAKKPKKPRTRGWTMFMEATDDEPAQATVPMASSPSAAPVAAAPAAAPVAAPVAAPPSLGAPSAPSLGAPTLGSPAAPSLGAPSLGAPTQAAPTLGPPARGAPAVGAPSLGAPAAAPVESKPSVRGWTMIMDDPEEAAAATPEVPAAAPTPGSPSTRGWTMLEELNESPPEAEVVAAQPATPEGAAPTSRGWTMFMEAELEGEQAEEAAPEPEPGFYEGEMATDSGTVIAFAPDAPKEKPAGAPVAAAPSSPVASPAAPEPMTSFGAQLRGQEEPVSSFGAQLRGDESAPEPEPTPLETTSESLAELANQATAAAPEPEPVAAPEMPSFGGPSLGGGGFDLKPTAPTTSPEPVDDYDDEPKKSNTGTIVAVVVMVAALAVIAYFLGT
ncbi:MAG: hypothetical protein R3A79_09730 [Nannocystaceae bacterium]